MLPDDSNRAGRAVRVFRIPSSAGTCLILEQEGRHYDLSHGLDRAHRGDLLELITGGGLGRVLDPSTFSRRRQVPEPERVLTPLEPRQVGKILAISRSPRDLFVANAPTDSRPWFTNRSPASLVASGSTLRGPNAEDGEHPDGSVMLHEIFLAAVIARRARGLELAEALDCVAGFMAASDITRRSLDGRPRSPWFGDSPEGTLTIGPAFTPRAALELGDLVVRAQRRREDHSEPTLTRCCARFGEEVALAVTALSRAAILHPGDLVLVPTAVALGVLAAGDEVHCSIDGIGELSTLIPGRSRLRRQA